jgi:hypothetical protein
MNMLTTNSHALADARSSADPDDISTQIDLIGMPRLKVGFKSLAAQNGGSVRASTMDGSHTN